MIIYEIINKVNNKKYIGQTIVTNPEKRFRAHRHNLRKNKHRNQHLQRAWNKYGEQNFEFKIIKQCKSLKELNVQEQKFIKSKGNYNIFEGGNNHVLPNTTKSKISKIKRPQGYPLIVDPNGKLHKIEPSLQAFAKKYNLTDTALRYLIYGKNRNGYNVHHHKGWHLEGMDKSVEQLRSDSHRSTSYPIIIGPDNKEYQIQNLRQFVKQHNLNRAHFRNVINGKYQQHKGWHIKGIPVVDPNVLRSWKMRGELHPMVKMTEDQVREMRKLSTQMSIRKLADRYNLPKTTAWNIVHRKTWKHIV